MTQAIFWLGSAPAEEQSVKLGSDDYVRNARIECRAYIAAIRKVCGHEPDGARLTVKSQPHDFGTYYEVAVVFNPDDQEAVEYAVKVERGVPTTWEEAGMTAPAVDEGRSR